MKLSDISSWVLENAHNFLNPGGSLLNSIYLSFVNFSNSMYTFRENLYIRILSITGGSFDPLSSLSRIFLCFNHQGGSLYGVQWKFRHSYPTNLWKLFEGIKAFFCIRGKKCHILYEWQFLKTPKVCRGRSEGV